MAVSRFLVRFRTNDEGGRSDKLAFVVLSCSASRIGGVPILANKAFGIRVVHRFDEGAFVETTNIYAEVDLERKTQALTQCNALQASGPSRTRWRDDPSLIAFPRAL